MPLVRVIYIIGFMGSGKTTTGEKLADSLGYSFADLDKMIENKAGRSIPEIFNLEGEAGFRKIEAEVLREIDPHRGIVVSTGGGTPCQNDNMKFMLSSGITVYIKLTPEQIAERLRVARGERPLLKNVPDENLSSFIENLLKEREIWYEMANIIIDGSTLKIADLHSQLKNFHQ
jgi:shikimate kinase